MPPQQVILQRNKHSVAPGIALFGLTIVCAVLGVVTNLSSGASEPQIEQIPTLQPSYILKNYSNAMQNCQDYG